MSHVRHHYLIVTTYCEDKATAALMQANACGLQTTELLLSPVNNYWTFFVGPDGSKEGWEDSEAGNQRRAAFCEWVGSQMYEDGSNSLQVLLVHDGEGEPEDDPPSATFVGTDRNHPELWPPVPNEPALLRKMAAHGGAFAKALAAAWLLADPHNAACLRASFGGMLARYEGAPEVAAPDRTSDFRILYPITGRSATAIACSAHQLLSASWMMSWMAAAFSTVNSSAMTGSGDQETPTDRGRGQA